MVGESKYYDRMVYEIAEEFNIAHPFYTIERYPDYFEIILPAHMRPAENSFIAVNQRTLPVKNKLRIDRIYLNNTIGSYLTQREFECVKLLILGKSAEEVGLIVGISKRTVEKYLENVKKKFSCTKTTQLIYELTKSGLIL
jgi:DNA-binding CsgD family transcriptional regulator